MVSIFKYTISFSYENRNIIKLSPFKMLKPNALLRLYFMKYKSFCLLLKLALFRATSKIVER